MTGEADGGDVVLRWAFVGERRGPASGDTDERPPDDSDDEGDYWSLVQWRDSRGTWRGVAPRTRRNQLRVPRKIKRGRRDVPYRVLVTSGIATGVAEWIEEIGEPPPEEDGPPVIVISGAPSVGSEPVEVPPVLSGTPMETFGLDTGQVRWFDGDGGEIGRGRRVDLRHFGVGQHLVTATTKGSPDFPAEGQWLIERLAGDRFLLHPAADLRQRREPDHTHEHPHRRSREDY